MYKNDTLNKFNINSLGISEECIWYLRILDKIIHLIILMLVKLFNYTNVSKVL